MKILILNGSPRPDGNTAAMAKAFAKAPLKADIRWISYRFVRKISAAAVPANIATPGEWQVYSAG